MQKTTKSKKRLGAALSALVVEGFMVLTALCMLADYFGGGGTWGEAVIIVVCAGIFFLIAGGIALALAQRWKEIEKGEEDEARKY